jgi:uncharacterized membrane protein YesL
MNMKKWVDKNYKTLIITAFLIPIVVVAIVSISHVTKWYGISNPVSWAIYLSIGIEIAALSSIAAISANLGNKIYLPFIVVTLIQFIGNIYFSYNYIDINSENFKSWVDLSSPLVGLLGVEPTDLIGHKRVLALFAGGLLPVISLSFLHFLVKFTEENKVSETKEEKPVEIKVESTEVIKTEEKPTIVETIEEKIVVDESKPEIVPAIDAVELNKFKMSPEQQINEPKQEPIFKSPGLFVEEQDDSEYFEEPEEYDLIGNEGTSGPEDFFIGQIEEVPSIETEQVIEDAENNELITAESAVNTVSIDEVSPVGPKREDYPFRGDGTPIEIFDIDDKRINKKILEQKQKVNQPITNKIDIIPTPVVTPTVQPELDPEYIRKNNQIKTFWRNVKNSKRVINK